MTANDPERSTTEHPDAPRPMFRTGWAARIPARIMGRFRTTTVVMVLAFLAVLVLWTNVRFDPTLNENSPVYVPPAPTSAEVQPQQTATRTSTPVPSTQSPATTATPAPQGGGVTTAPAPTTTAETTTRAPGFTVPTIPGVPLPRGTN